jgi:hypothetical protein
VFVVATLAVLLSSALAPALAQEATAGKQGATGKPGPAPSLIRVFVETDPGDGKEFTNRQQSVKDLSEALAAKKKIIVIVDDEDKADVVVEVVERDLEVPKVVLGVDVRPGRSTGMNAPVTRATLKLRLTSGPDELDLKNKNTANDNPGGWKSAAEDLAGQIEKWINSNKADILLRRGAPVLVSLQRVK